MSEQTAQAKAAALQQRMEQLRAQFVARSLGDLGAMNTLLARIREGDAAAARDMEMLAHKINGTGATFGFVAVSARAADIERMVAATHNPGVSFAAEGDRAGRIAAGMLLLRRELEVLAK